MKVELQNQEFSPIHISVVLEKKRDIEIIEALSELIESGVSTLHEKNKYGMISQSLELKYSLAADFVRNLKKYAN